MGEAAGGCPAKLAMVRRGDAHFYWALLSARPTWYLMKSSDAPDRWVLLFLSKVRKLGPEIISP